MTAIQGDVLSLSAEIRMQISLADAVGVDVNVHVDSTVFFIVDYLIAEKGIACEESDTERLKASFRFVLCSQADYRNYIKE